MPKCSLLEVLFPPITLRLEDTICFIEILKNYKERILCFDLMSCSIDIVAAVQEYISTIYTTCPVYVYVQNEQLTKLVALQIAKVTMSLVYITIKAQ